MTTRILFATLFALALFSLPASAQLTSQLEELQGMIYEVQVGKDNYQQQLDFDTKEPFRLHFTRTEIDKKGREEVTEYFWNLGHVEARQIRWEDGKDQIRVILDMGSKDYIKVVEDGEVDGFESDLSILALDIDNARAMVDLLKEIVPAAQEAWEATVNLPEGYQALRKFIAERVVNVQADDDGFDQSWTYEQDHPSRVSFAQSETGDDERMEYRFNLADLNAKKVGMDVDDSFVTVELTTDDKKDYIQVLENGVVDDYTDAIKLVFTEIDEALLVAEALEKIIPFGQEAQTNYFPQEGDLQTALAGLNANLQGFTIDETSYEPSIGDECRTEYALQEDDDAFQYIFDWADMDAKSVDINIKSEEVSVKVNTANKKDYVQVFENGERDKYTDAISFPVPDIPTAKLVQHWVKGIIKGCPSETATEDYGWLEEAIQEGAVSDEDVSQRLELLEDNSCKWLLTVQDDDDENVYEFNLYDINPKSIELDISGAAVQIEFEAVGKNEIIKVYKNGEETGFTEDLTFEVADVLTGKTAVATLQALVEGCEQ